MATSFYFDHYGNDMEQELIEDLVSESIRIYGIDVYYIPRTLVNRDELYTEDDSSSYNSAHLIDMWVKSNMGFQGSGEFLSKFNLMEIRDTLILSVSKRTFLEEVGDTNGLIRPREGDLIYFPLNHKIFKISFVEQEAIFYQLGALQTFDLTCELFEYSNELFNTGIPYIDALDDQYSFNLAGEGILLEDLSSLADERTGLPIFQEYSGTFFPKSTEMGEDNEYFQTEGSKIIDFSEWDPFAEGGKY